jgi:hypothetical protein
MKKSNNIIIISVVVVLLIAIVIAVLIKNKREEKFSCLQSLVGTWSIPNDGILYDMYQSSGSVGTRMVITKDKINNLIIIPSKKISDNSWTTKPGSITSSDGKTFEMFFNNETNTTEKYVLEQHLTGVLDCSNSNTFEAKLINIIFHTTTDDVRTSNNGIGNTFKFTKIS